MPFVRIGDVERLNQIEMIQFFSHFQDPFGRYLCPYASS